MTLVRKVAPMGTFRFPPSAISTKLASPVDLLLKAQYRERKAKRKHLREQAARQKRLNKINQHKTKRDYHA